MAFTLPSSIIGPWARLTGIGKSYKSEAAARRFVRDVALRPQPYAPPKRLRRDVTLDVDRWRGWPIYRVRPRATPPSGTVVFAHGGGWVNEMSPLHWHLVAELAARSGRTFTIPIYPLIPFGRAAEVIADTVDFVREAQAADPRTAMMGDSAGGQITVSTALELRDRHGLTLDDTILLSPALDLRLDNPEIDAIEPHDPLLGRAGTRYFVDLWRGDLPLTDLRVSPIEGDLTGLGRMLIFSGTNDILAPDIRLFVDKLRAAGVPHEFHEAPDQVHDYPLVPIPAAREAREAMVRRLQQ